MEYNFDRDKPIYKQIVDQIRIEIITESYKIGDKIPSVRDLAIKMKVNPNTINRALLELEETGLIATKRTSGKFVTDDKMKIESEKELLAKEIIEKFINDVNKINMNKKDVLRLLEGKDF